MKRWTIMASAFVVAIGLFLSAGTADAQIRRVCVLHDDVIAQLEDKFAEQNIGRGLVENGRAIVELFVSKTGSWTVIVTDTAGRSCIVASGMSWMQTPLLVGDPA